MSDKKKKSEKGVGQLPAWWMELTPHYVLDLDEEASRREQEERMARYFAEMALADAAAGEQQFDEHGNPIAPGSAGWKSNWAGRGSGSGNGNDDESTISKIFGGRNFKPGSPSWDPKQWGIKENDPDYKSYLTGAKLPPDYMDAMRMYGATKSGVTHPEWVMNAFLRSGDGSSGGHAGLYGRQAETPKHQPAWAKKKLRSSTAGANIRQGKYNDSPNKHLHPGMHPIANALLQQNQAKANATPRVVVAVSEEEPVVESSTGSSAAAVPEQAPQPRQPRQYQPREKEPEAPAAAAVPEQAPQPRQPRQYQPREEEPEAPLPEAPKVAVKKDFNFNSYYHNASADQVATVKSKARTAAMQEQAPDPEPQYAEEEEYAEEEYVEEEYEEEEYVEEYEEEEQYAQAPAPAPAAAASSELQDLQAILAAKQAELMRLQQLQ